MNWRKNGKKLSRRKAIREEAARRMSSARDNPDPLPHADAMCMYLWARDKIRRYYDVAPMSQWWPSPNRKK